MRPIGDWSTITTSSISSCAAQRAVRAGRLGRLALGLAQRGVEHVLHQRRLARAGDAGDAHQALRAGWRRRCPSGCARRRRGARCFGARWAGGVGAAPASARLRPERYSAVSVVGRPSAASGVPKNTISPPRSPGPGPMSRMRSAANMICGSCSTTTSELPASRSRCITPITRPMSRGCRPIDGSSSTNSVLTSEVPSAVVRLMRCTSPPESVRDWRSSVR